MIKLDDKAVVGSTKVVGQDIDSLDRLFPTLIKALNNTPSTVYSF